MGMNLPGNTTLNRSYPVPGATVVHKRLEDIAAIKQALQQIDTDIQTIEDRVNDISANGGGAGGVSSFLQLDRLSNAPDTPASGAVIYALDSIDTSVNLIGDIDQNETSEGTASASSIYNSSTDAWCAFRNNITLSNGWLQANGASHPQWVQFEFPVEQQVFGVTIRPWDADTWPARVWGSFDILGSNDTVSWDVIGQYVNISGGWSAGQYRLFEFNQPVTYKAFRFLVKTTAGDGFIGIRHIRLHGGGGPEKVFIKNSHGTIKQL